MDRGPAGSAAAAAGVSEPSPSRDRWPLGVAAYTKPAAVARARRRAGGTSAAIGRVSSVGVVDVVVVRLAVLAVVSCLDAADAPLVVVALGFEPDPAVGSRAAPTP